jgi:hypothetical protein
MAHRVAYTLCYGPIPNGLQVCHRCDNPPCCNPYHLFLGTIADNMADKKRKGRARAGWISGERHWASKLTEDDVRAIRAALTDGTVTMVTLAAQYGVSAPTIFSIKHRRHWRHIV